MAKKSISPTESWIVAVNVHEAIVSKDAFKLANEMAFTGRKKTSKNGGKNYV